MLDNIQLSKREVLRLREKKINYGGESIIVRPDIPNTIFKLYRQSVSDKERENKHQKLELIDSKDIRFITKSQGVLTCEDRIVGHAYDYDRDDISFLLAPLSLEEKILSLRRIKMILNYFKRNGIIFADLKSDNILINPKTGKIKFCDMDSVQIDGLKTSIHEEYLLPLFKDGMLDERVHVYLHNLMVIDELLTNTSDSYIDALEEIDLEKVKRIFNRDCQKIIEYIVKRKSNYYDLYLIDGINPQSIVKYKKR